MVLIYRSSIKQDFLTFIIKFSNKHNYLLFEKDCLFFCSYKVKDKERMFVVVRKKKKNSNMYKGSFRFRRTPALKFAVVSQDSFASSLALQKIDI